MRGRRGRRGRRRFRRNGAVPGIRRYLLCLRNDASDTDSDSIPLSSLLDANGTDAVDYSSSLLRQMNNDVGSINPAVCSGLMQMYSQVDAGADMLADTSQLLARRVSVMRSAMPLFADHLQLPLFTGQRRWHTMFGQLSQLTSSGCGCNNTPAFNTDEDVLADSNFASLFDSPPDVESHRAVEPLGGGLQATCRGTDASCMATEGCHTVEESPALSETAVMDSIDNSFPTLDENADSVQSAVELFMVNENVRHHQSDTNHEIRPLSVTSIDCSCDMAGNIYGQSGCSRGDLAGERVGESSGNQSHTLRGRRHSDPGSIHSNTTVSSTNSNSDNWYYYDRRLRPGGALAAQYGRLQARRSLSVMVLPPAYDDAVHNVAASATVDRHTTDRSCERSPTVSQTACDNLTELPPPYRESTELPPSYSEVTDAVADASEQLGTTISPPLSTNVDYSWPSCSESWQAGETTRCSENRGMFSGRPAVRWNRNTRVERWTSSFNWVMS